MNGLQRLQQQLATREAAGLRRTLRACSSPCAPLQEVEGSPQAMLAFASNDYLGLANHPQLRQALQEGVTQHGVGAGASHLINGHHQVHAQLEQALAATQAAYIPDVRALYLGSGYLANVGLLPALAALDESAIFSADLNHASIIDGCRLARATLQVWPHQDLATLAAQLAASTARQKIVVSDAVFSMDGAIAPVAELLALCEEHDAWLVLDDAHGFGVLGADGHGVLQHAAVHSARLVYMGTLGKAAGVGGAFIAAHALLIEWLLQTQRSYIFTTASAPALAHALLCSLALIQSAEGAARRAHLQTLRAQWQGWQPRHPGWRKLASPSAIQPLIVGDNQAALQLAQQLWQRGLWVPAIRPPTVPPGTARLRISLSAAHSHTQLQTLIDTLEQL